MSPGERRTVSLVSTTAQLRHRTGRFEPRRREGAKERRSNTPVLAFNLASRLRVFAFRIDAAILKLRCSVRREAEEMKQRRHGDTETRRTSGPWISPATCRDTRGRVWSGARVRARRPAGREVTIALKRGRSRGGQQSDTCSGGLPDNRCPAPSRGGSARRLRHRFCPILLLRASVSP